MTQPEDMSAEVGARANPDPPPQPTQAAPQDFERAEASSTSLRAAGADVGEPTSEPAPAATPEPTPATSEPPLAIPEPPTPERAPAGSPTLERAPSGSAQRLVSFVGEQPFLSAFFVFMVVVSPFLLVEAQARMRYARLDAGLNAWEVALGRAGLPVPFLASAEVALPVSLRGIPLAAYERAELGERYGLLLGWRELLAGRPLGDVAEAEGLGAALVACDRYRQAAQLPQPPAELLRGGRALGGKGPEPFRATLDLVGELFAGRHQQVIHQVEGDLASAHPACIKPLEALRLEATRRRVLAVLSLRPATAEDLEELLTYVGTPDLDAKALLAQRASELPSVLSGGSQDLGRARSLLKLLLAVYPDGLPQDSLAFEAWTSLAAPIGAMLQSRLSQDGGDTALAIEVVALAGQLDPHAELVPLETFAAWRERLRGVIDDPARLAEFTRRFFELGLSPAGLEDVVLKKGLEPSLGGGKSAGGVLFELLVKGQRADPVALQARLDALLGTRRDPSARRVRARFAHMRGRLALATGRLDEAARFLERSGELGFEPSFRRLRDATRCAVLQRDAEKAQRLGREALRSLEEHAARLRSASPHDLLGWELDGYPVHSNLLDPVRADLRLDLAELLAPAAVADATRLCDQAKRLDPRNPRRLLIQARLLVAQQRKDEARKLVFDGLRGLRGPGHETLQRELRELLRELGPN